MLLFDIFTMIPKSHYFLNTYLRKNIVFASINIEKQGEKHGNNLR